MRKGEEKVRSLNESIITVGVRVVETQTQSEREQSLFRLPCRLFILFSSNQTIGKTCVITIIYLYSIILEFLFCFSFSFISFRVCVFRRSVSN